MSENPRIFVVPQRLDDPPKFLFWDFDVALVFIVGVSLGVAVGFMSIGLLFGIGGAYAWSKSRSGRHPGYAIHLVYWNVPVNFFKRTPPSARRRYCG